MVVHCAAKVVILWEKLGVGRWDEKSLTAKGAMKAKNAKTLDALQLKKRVSVQLLCALCG
jgi:hypothetical protein